MYTYRQIQLGQFGGSDVKMYAYRQIQLGQFGGSYIKMYAYRQIEILENGYGCIHRTYAKSMR